MRKERTRQKAGLLIAALLLLGTACGSSSQAGLNVQELGESLVVEYYEALKLGDKARLEAKFASGFQSVTSNRVSSREAVIATIDAETFGDYELSNFVTTQGERTLIVSYRGTIEINGEVSAPTWRVNVFEEIDGSWLGIAFADAGGAS